MERLDLRKIAQFGVSVALALTLVPPADALLSEQASAQQQDAKRPASSIGTDNDPTSADGSVLPGRNEVVAPAEQVTDVGPQAPRYQLGKPSEKSSSPKLSGFVQGRSVELIDERDANKKVFRNPDGTKTAEFSVKPVHALDPDKKWKDIDTRFEGKDGRLKTKHSRTAIDLGERANDAAVQNVRFSDGSRVMARIDGAKNVKATHEGGSVRYNDVLPNVDFKYTPEDWGLKEDLILKSPAAASTFTFPISLDGLIAQMDDATKDVKFVNSAGEEVGRMTHGWMEDSNVDPHTAQGAISDGVSLSLIPWGRDGTAVQMTVDRTWLNDSSRVYPVTVDPTTINMAAAADDTFVMSGFTANSSGVNPLSVGTYDGGSHVGAAYMRFDGLNALGADARVLNATYSAWNSHSWSCTARGVGVYKVTQAWNGATMTGYPGASYGDRVLWGEFAMGYSSACPAGLAYWDSQANPSFHSLVQGWVNGSIPNFGLTMRVDPGSVNDNFAFKKFNSTEGNSQKLTVTYSTHGALYNPASTFTVSPTATTPGTVKVVVTNTGRDCWPANGNYKLSYHLYDSNYNLVRWDNPRTPIPQAMCKGNQLLLEALVNSEPPGQYFAEWDMVEEGVRWFGRDEGVPTQVQAFTISNAKPQITSASPLAGQQVTTNTPSLSVTSSDPDNFPTAPPQYQFKICRDVAMTVACQDSGWIAPASWTPSALAWDALHYWQARVSDTADVSAFSTPTPLIVRAAQTFRAHVGNDANSATIGGVNMASGNFSMPVVDQTVAGVGIPLQVSRVYNSADPVDGAFGRGWSFNFGSRVHKDADDTLRWILPDGREVRIAKNPDGSYPASPMYMKSLTVTSGGYAFEDKSGAKWTYDSTGRLVEIKSVAGQTLMLTYDGSGQLDAVWNDFSQRGLYFGWTGGHITRVVTDGIMANGWGYVWDYHYSGDKLTSACNPKPSGSDCTNYEYGSFGGQTRLTKVTLPKGNVSAELDYSPNGEVSSRTDGAGQDWTYSFSTAGGIRTAVMTDPRNNSNTYVFDASLRLTSVKDANDQTKTFEYGPMGFLWKVTDALGHAIELGSDERGNTVRRTVQRGGQAITTYYSYFNGAAGDSRNGKLIEVRDGRSTGPTDNTYLSTITYNALGLMTSKSIPATSDFPSGRLSQWTYSTGSESAIGGGSVPAGLLLTARDPSNAVTSYSYDARGDMRRVVDPVGLRTDLTYDALGRAVTSTEISDSFPAGLLTTLAYDELNQVISKTEPTVINELNNGARTRRTNFTFDANLNLLSETVNDVEGRDVPQTTTYAYDNADRVTSITDAAGGVQTQTWDTAGNLASTTSPKGVRTKFAYSPRNELTTTTVENFVEDPIAGSSPRDLRTETRTYDNAGRVDTVTDALGRTKQMRYYDDNSLQSVVLLAFRNSDSTTRDVALESYVYDKAGNVVNEVRGGNIQDVQRSFDAAGRMTAETLDPAGLNRTTTYTYDANNNVTRQIAAQSGSSTETRYSYDIGNRLLSTTVENGAEDAVSTNQWDQRGLLISTVEPRGNVAGANPEDFKTRHQNDALGRRVATTHPKVPTVTGTNPTTGFSKKVNFQTSSATTPSAYSADWGLAYDATRGYGWQNLSGTPQAFTDNSRERNVQPDKRLDTLMHFKLGTSGEGRWEMEVPNGTYVVTVGLGDPSYEDSHHVVRAEGSSIADFTPTSQERNKVFTASVTVGDGRLTLDQSGGTNTKIDFVDVTSSAQTPPPEGTSVAKVNFQSAAASTPSGYSADWGQAYDPVRGYGWENQSGAPQDFLDNGRDRNVHSDQRLDTFMHIKLGQSAEGRWQLNVPNGNYNLSIGVGDPSYDDSRHLVRAEGATVVDFTPSPSERNKIVNSNVTVEDGRLTLDQTGGTNAKIDFIDVANGPLPQPGGQPITEQLNLTSKTGYDVFDNAIATRTEDESDGVTTYEYDKLNRLISTTTPFGSTPSIDRWSYDADDNLMTETDSRGQTTSYDYDKLNRVVRTTEPKLASEPSGAKLRSKYDDVGNLVETIDQRGAKINYGYDDMNRRVSEAVVERTPTSATFTSNMTYDDAGRLLSRTDPLGRTTSTQYNDAGEVVGETDQLGKVTSITRNVRGQATQITDPLNRKQVNVYDGAGRLISTGNFDAGGVQLRSASFGYDRAGNATSAASFNGWVTTKTYDAVGRMLTMAEPVSATKSIVTTLGYDKNSNQVTLTNGNGATTVTSFNELNLPATVVEPATNAHPNIADRTWSMSYDPSGLMTGATAPGGVVSTRTYDELGRNTGQSATGGSGGPVSKSFGYDLVGNLTSLGTAGGTQTFIRNDRGEIVSQSGPQGSASFTYDAAGQLTSRVNAAGTTAFTYTARGQLATLADPVTATTSTHSYDNAGQRTATTVGTTPRAFAYDGLGRVVSDQLGVVGSSNRRSTSYGYDADDNVTSKTISGSGLITESNVYTYDRSRRMTSSVRNGASTAYTWDDAGNRTTSGSVSAAYDERNRLVSDTAGGGTSYSYSPRGTLSSSTVGGQTTNLVFDSFDRLISDSSDPGATFSYDSMDRLVKRNSTTFTYDGESIHLTSDGTQTYARDPDDVPVSFAQGSTKLATITDRRGDVTGSFVPGGALTANRASYDPFGMRTATGTVASLGFQGSWTNPSSSQQRTSMFTRWYTPSSAQFASRDRADVPVRVGIDANRFTYASGNPMTFNDPRGQQTATVPLNPGLSLPGLSGGTAGLGSLGRAGSVLRFTGVGTLVWAFDMSLQQELARQEQAYWNDAISNAILLPHIVPYVGETGSGTSTARSRPRSTTTARPQVKAAPPKQYPPAPPLPSLLTERVFLSSVTNFATATTLGSAGGAINTESVPFVVPSVSDESLACIVAGTCFEPNATTQGALADNYIDPFGGLDPSDDLICPAAQLLADTAVDGGGMLIPCGSAMSQTGHKGNNAGQFPGQSQMSSGSPMGGGGSGGRSQQSQPPPGDPLPKPAVSNVKLRNVIDDLYKGTTNPGRVGTGTTADAVRNELATGSPTSGRFHSQKATQYSNALRSILKQDLSTHDRLVAQSSLDDLQRALQGKP